jgi:hypothetical protein
VLLWIGNTSGLLRIVQNRSQIRLIDLRVLNSESKILGLRAKKGMCLLEHQRVRNLRNPRHSIISSKNLLK